MQRMGIVETYQLTTMNSFVENATLNLEQQVFLGGIINDLCRIGEIVVNASVSGTDVERLASSSLASDTKMLE